jgi:4-hydroxybenzoate polyprenyltransferase
MENSIKEDELSKQGKVTPAKFATNYGIMLGGLMIVIAIVMYFTGMLLEGVQWPMILFYIAFPSTIFYVINKYKKTNANQLSLSEALKTGIVVAIISAIVYAIYTMIFNYIIDPEFIGEILKITEEKLLENPDIPAEIAEKQMEWVTMFTNPIVGSVFWIALSLFFGLIYSLISGLIMKTA